MIIRESKIKEELRKLMAKGELEPVGIDRQDADEEKVRKVTEILNKQIKKAKIEGQNGTISKEVRREIAKEVERRMRNILLTLDISSIKQCHIGKLRQLVTEEAERTEKEYRCYSKRVDHWKRIGEMRKLGMTVSKEELMDNIIDLVIMTDELEDEVIYLREERETCGITARNPYEVKWVDEEE